MSLHVNRQLLALRELFWAEGAMEVFDSQVNLFVRFQDMLIKKGFAATIKFTFELSLCRVSYNMTLQVVFVAALLSTGWANNFLCPTLGLGLVT